MTDKYFNNGLKGCSRSVVKVQTARLLGVLDPGVVLIFLNRSPILPAIVRVSLSRSGRFRTFKRPFTNVWSVFTIWRYRAWATWSPFLWMRGLRGWFLHVFCLGLVSFSGWFPRMRRGHRLITTITAPMIPYFTRWNVQCLLRPHIVVIVSSSRRSHRHVIFLLHHHNLSHKFHLLRLRVKFRLSFAMCVVSFPMFSITLL